MAWQEHVLQRHHFGRHVVDLECLLLVPKSYLQLLVKIACDPTLTGIPVKIDLGFY